MKFKFLTALILLLSLLPGCTKPKQQTYRHVHFKVAPSFGGSLVYDVRLIKNEFVNENFIAGKDELEYYRNFLGNEEMRTVNALIDSVWQSEDLEPNYELHQFQLDLLIDKELYFRKTIYKLDQLPKDVRALLDFLTKESGMEIAF